MTNNNLKIAVSAIWIFGFMNGIFTALKISLALYYIGSLITISCVVLVTFAYVILYHETHRHRRKIKAQQLPQGEVERSTIENKALKTTVSVLGAVIVSLLPVGFCIIGLAKDLFDTWPINEPLWQTCVMLNSLVNALIYCFRQKEMRKVVFRKRTQVIYRAMQCRRVMGRKISERMLTITIIIRIVYVHFANLYLHFSFTYGAKFLSHCFLWRLLFSTGYLNRSSPAKADSQRTAKCLWPWFVFSGDEIKFLTLWKSSRFGITINPL